MLNLLRHKPQELGRDIYRTLTARALYIGRVNERLLCS
jgi:hypothetical protein